MSLIMGSVSWAMVILFHANYYQRTYTPLVGSVTLILSVGSWFGVMWVAARFKSGEPNWE